jgi:hypothetical protein
MKRILLLAVVAAVLPSCADYETTKPLGPVSNTSRIPWNTPVAGQGGGQMGMLDQNKYRR